MYSTLQPPYTKYIYVHIKGKRLPKSIALPLSILLVINEPQKGY